MATDLIPFEINNTAGSNEPELPSNLESGSFSWFPLTDMERDNLGQIIKLVWPEYPELTSQSLPMAEFIADIDNFHTVFINKDVLSSNANYDSIELNTILDEANRNITFVKDYLKERYGIENFRLKFPKFGIIKTSNNSYALPRNFSDISTRMEMLINAMEEEQFTTQTYGLAYWQNLYDRILELQRKTQRNTGKKSMVVNDKATLRSRVDRGFRILKKIIEGNYYDNPVPVLIAFGYMRKR